MLKKVAALVSLILLAETLPFNAISAFAAAGDKHTVTFKDQGMTGEFGQGTACGKNGTSYGTTENRDGELYVVVSELNQGEVEEGQYHVGAPNTVPYSTLTKAEQSFLTAYKGYRYRTTEEDAEGNITYTYYAFKGWQVDSEGTGTLTRDGETVKPGEQVLINGDTTFTAKWGLDVNRNGISDDEEGDFEILYMSGKDEDGTSAYKLASDSIPNNHKITAEIQNPIAPFYEITQFNDPSDAEIVVGVKKIEPKYLPHLDKEYAEENDLHKAFVGWEYDLTSPGQDSATITEAPKDTIDNPSFTTAAADLFTNYYYAKMMDEVGDTIDGLYDEGKVDEAEELTRTSTETYMGKAEAEASKYYSKTSLVYHLQPGTKGIIKTREWNTDTKSYAYLCPQITCNTNVVLRAIWEDDMNDNDVPDSEESAYTINYVNNEAGYTGTLPTDSTEYHAGEIFETQPINGTVPGKVFMGWVDSYWNDQYNITMDPYMEHYGYAGKYPNIYHLYVAGTDYSWADDFENRYSHEEDSNIIVEKGKSVVGDGTVPHSVDEEEAGPTFPVYDEDGNITGTSFLTNVVDTGDKKGEITLTAWWAEDKNNNNVPDIVEPQSQVQYVNVAKEMIDPDKSLGTTNMLNNIDPEEDADLYEEYSSGEKKIVISGYPADMTAFTNDWVTVPKDDTQLGTDYWIPKLDEETRKDLKLIFKDWMFVASGTRSIPFRPTAGTAVISGIVAAPTSAGAVYMKNGSPETLISGETELQPGDIFKLTGDTYLVSTWYNDINENDEPDELETKYTVKYAAGTDQNVTNLPQDQTDVLEGTEQTVAEAVPYREGYSFTGWKCSTDGIIYKADQTFSMPKDNVVFEATWANTTYLLEYLDKSGNRITAYNYAGGQNIALLSQDDYEESEEVDGETKSYRNTFTGWMDLETGQVYSTSYKMPEKNAVLQAYYTRVELREGKEVPTYYRVSYDGNPSSEVTDIPVDITAYKEGSVVIISYTIPSRSGYIFKGWSYNNTTYEPGNFITMGTENITLSAVWEEDRNQSQTTTTTEPSSETTTTATDPSTEATTTDTDPSSEATTATDTDRLDISGNSSVDPANKATYPTLSDPISVTNGLEVYVNGSKVESGENLTAVVDTTTGKATFADDAVNLAIVVPDNYTGTDHKPGDVLLLNKDNYDIEYVDNDGSSPVGYLILTGKGPLTGSIVIPFNVKVPQVVTPDKTNVTGKAKNNLKYTDLPSVVTFDNTYLDNKISQWSIGLLGATSSGSTGTNTRPSDYYKLLSSIEGISPAQGVKAIVLGMFTDDVVASVNSNPNGIHMESTFREKLFSDGDTILALDVLPIFKKSYYDGLLADDAFIDVQYNADAFDNQHTYKTIGTLYLKDLDYNEVTYNGETYITPMWQTIACEITDDLEALSEPNLNISLHIPNYTGQAADKNAYKLAIDNLRVGKASTSGADDADQNYTFIQEGLVPTDASTVPTDVTKAVSITGIRVVPNPIGTVNTMTPYPTIYNSTTGDKLTRDTDYTVEIKYDMASNFGLVIITGKGHYTGTAILPFKYDANGSSIEESTEGTTSSVDDTVYYEFEQVGLDINDTSTYPNNAFQELAFKNISVEPNPLGYQTSNNIKLTITNTQTDVTLTEGIDYTISASYDNNAQLGYVTVTGIGKYKGTLKLPYEIEGGSSTPEPSTKESTTKESSTETTTSSTPADTGVTKIGMTNYAITYNDLSTYPPDLSADTGTYGFKLSTNYLGTVKTTEPTLDVYDAVTGDKLTKDTDYRLTYNWVNKNDASHPYYLVIEGLGKYSGFIAIPFVSSDSKQSSSGKSNLGSSGGNSSSKASGGSSGGGGGGGGSTSKKVEIKFIIGDYGYLDSTDKVYDEDDVEDNTIVKAYSVGTSLTVPKISAEDGYEFLGWSTDTTKDNIIKSGKFKPTEATNYYAIYKNTETDEVVGNSVDNRTVEVGTEETTEETTSTYTEATTEATTQSQEDVIEHKGYINGYNDHSFRPNAPITRAEACSLFAKVLNLDTSAISSTFTDVPDGAWYLGAVEAVKNSGITAGYNDGTFRPNNNITRAEFVTLIAKAKGVSGTSSSFSDIEGSWAYNYICGVAEKGWVGGYNDGTFRPNNNITRAEAVVMLNRMLGRTPDTDFISNTYQELFSDVPTSYWGYAYIFEAAVTHYIKSEDYTNSHETWVAFN